MISIAATTQNLIWRELLTLCHRLIAATAPHLDREL